MSPVLASQVVGSLRRQLFCSSKGVKLIHFNDLSGDVLKQVLIGKLCLLKGSPNPAMNRSWMHSFDSRDCFKTQAFQDLMNRAKDFFFRRLEVIKSRSESVAEGLSAKLAAKNESRAIAGRITTVIIYVDSRSTTECALPGKRYWLGHSKHSLPLSFL